MPQSEASLEKELRDLLNRHSVENESDTPDFVLSQYLLDCLAAYNCAVRAREDQRVGRGE